MLEYGWGNAGEVLISGETPGQQHGQAAGQVLDHYQQSLPAGNFFSSAVPLYSQPELPTSTNKPEALYPLPSPWQPSGLSEILPGLPYRLSVPKAEEISGLGNGEYPPQIGLNLGGRTYFSSSSEDDFLSRLYRRCRASDPGTVNSPRCQAEGCMADLAHAKHYHRRHKVCELHSKAATVVAAGLTQRFCQQCSRFHLLSEFDQGKRSCRRRLADHNRRRRKSQPHQSQSGNNGSPISATTSKSSSESGGASRSSSVTIAVSPPRIALDFYGSGRQEAASSSATSIFIVSPPATFGPLDCSRIWDDKH